MKNKNISKKSIVIVLASFLVLPAITLAAGNANIDMELFSENIEKIIEILNLVVALFAGMYAVKLAALSQGGSMEKTWNTLAITAVLFVLLEVNNSLAGFGLIHIGGLEEIIEFVFVAVFAYCLYFTKKDLLKKTLG